MDWIGKQVEKDTIGKGIGKGNGNGKVKKVNLSLAQGLFRQQVYNKIGEQKRTEEKRREQKRTEENRREDNAGHKFQT